MAREIRAIDQKRFYCEMEIDNAVPNVRFDQVDEEAGAAQDVPMI